MIAAASFGLRRSGTFATATSGAAYWAASVRHGPPWPLPVNAPKSIFQNSNPIQGRELSGLLSLLKTPNRGENLEIFASRPTVVGMITILSALVSPVGQWPV